MKYKAIIVEDKDNDWIIFLSDLLKKVNLQQTNIFVAYTQSEALQIITENQIDIAFVDITLPIKSAQSPEVINAGLEIIKQIAENDITQNRNSLVFLFSNNINDPEVDGYKELVAKYTNRKIIPLPKFNLQSQKAKPRLIETIFKEILDWQLTRLTNLSTPDLTELKKAIENPAKFDKYYKFNLNNHEYTFDELILLEVGINGKVYFSQKELEDYVDGLLKKTNGPKAGNWNIDSKLQYRSEYFAEIAPKLNIYKKTIFENANTWFSIITENKYSTKFVSEWKATEDPFSSRAKKNGRTTEILLRKLSWRLIVLRIYTEKLEKYKSLSTLYLLNTKGEFKVFNTEVSGQDLGITHLGFNMLGDFLVLPWNKNDLFEHEEEYLKKLKK